MQFFYENQNSNSFLVYRLNESDKLDSFNYGMLANNRIDGIIPANHTQINAEKYLKYNVSSTVTLTQYFEGIVNKNRIINVFLSIANSMIEAEDYMIDTSMFVLDSDYIFVDVSSAKASIICFPIVGYSSNVRLIDFFKNIIFTTQYDRTEDSDYVAEIITFLNSSESFSIQNFKKMLMSLNSVALPLSHNQTIQQEPRSVPIQPKAKVKTEVKQFVQHQSISTAPAKLPENKKTPVQYETPDESANSATAADRSEQTKQEKMSFFHLLSNFSKENFEIYKSQKEQSANGQQIKVSVEATPQKEKKKLKNKQSETPQGNPVAGFAIPGQNSTPLPKKSESAPSQIQVQQVNTKSPIANDNVIPITPSSKIEANSANFGQTTALGAMVKDTTVLGGMVSEDNKPVLNPRIIRSKNNETIPINKPVFRIGKENSYVDYFIADNSAISRSHANIVNREEGFFIIDTNSTNHTYINGIMAQSNVETLINDKDMIRLANEDFEFRLY